MIAGVDFLDFVVWFVHLLHDGKGEGGGSDSNRKIHMTFPLSIKIINYDLQLLNLPVSNTLSFLLQWDLGLLGKTSSTGESLKLYLTSILSNKYYFYLTVNAFH